MRASQASPEVIYDLTSTSRMRSTTPGAESRPVSRTIGVQTDTMPKNIHHCKHHKKVIRRESSRRSQKTSAPNMLTIEKIWTGPDPNQNYLAPEYMDPQDARYSPESLKPRIGQFHSDVPAAMRPKSAQKRHKQVELSRLDILFQPCLNVHQRRVVKYNMLLSIAINFLVFALGATGFVSIINGNASEKPSFQYVLIAASFSMCYALLSLTTDAVALLALHRRTRELLIPWLIWYIIDMATYVSVMVLVIIFMDNYLILLVVFKIVWTLFVWVNVRDLYTTGKIYGPAVRRKLKSDILY